MLPFIGPYQTSVVLFFAANLIAIAVVFARFRKSFRVLRLAAMVLAVASSALIGSRILHVIWERPAYFLEHPLEAFTRLDGMVFYGAFAGGIAAMILVSRTFFKKPEDYRDIWDIGAIMVALSAGLLRLACFAEGCCWGQPTALPWAVRFYHPKTVMPWIGIPVHPTQLYDASIGFAMAALFVYVYKTGRPEWMRGRLTYFFGMFYGSGRFVTEFFRGDSFRGEDVALSLSTSQLISIGVVVLSFVLWIRTLPQLESRKEAARA
jgi:phosphatidylglycerol:prolipoprotein diacylglycerol transferase